MIALYLLAAHLTGDFVLQTRWQAARKLHDPGVRLGHVVTYTLPFIPIAVVYAKWPTLNGLHWEAAGTFLGWVILLHYLTDSYRFTSTLGDTVGWWVMRRHDPERTTRDWVDYLYGDRELIVMPMIGGPKPKVDPHLLAWRNRQADRLARGRLPWPPPNPWTTLPILLDQTLHIVQLAALAAIFLR